MKPRFLIAKYIPDTHRMEPRNIGVVAWTAGRVEARFLGESAAPKKLRAPSFVNSGNADTYRAWIASWRDLLSRNEIMSADEQESATVDSPTFLDLFRGYSRDNYVLTEGGTSLDPVSSAQLSGFVEYLFATFVAEPTRVTNESESEKRREARELNTAFKKVMSDAGVTRRPDYQTNVNLPCRVDETQQWLPFDAYLGGKNPAVIQKVSLYRPESVFATAGYFEAVAKAGKVAPERCAAFVHVPEGVPADDERRGRWEWIAKSGKIINLADEPNAIRQVQGLTAAA